MELCKYQDIRLLLPKQGLGGFKMASCTQCMGVAQRKKKQRIDTKDCEED